ncbi:MAG: hypothetical protein JWM95_565, partial [Gemmatimonadetes bacterium]|nr:hypothetical protein [Gemmatimonadota bacterium]
MVLIGSCSFCRCGEHAPSHVGDVDDRATISALAGWINL